VAKPEPITGVLMHYPVVALCEDMAAKCSGTNEEGGILLGNYRGPHLEILNFTTSGPEDLRGRFSFERQDTKHQKEAQSQWETSGHTTTFAGEWHTHPYGDPCPSTTDKNSWKRLAKHTGATLVFVVVAPRAWSVFLVKPKAIFARIKSLRQTSKGELGVVFS
jgi:integrative and conjugative element protein (TIGR02256 family)